MNVVAVIPARGGSKGIPRKNIYPLAGQPLIAHTIGHARATPEITRIVVSTDDAAIAQVAKEYGAEVVMRPAEISGDTASSESALVHTLAALRAEGYEPDLVVFLQATSPLRRPDEISRAIQQLIKERADSLFSACTVHGFMWRRVRPGVGAPESFSYDFRNRPRRQDAPEDVIENGSIYVFRPRILDETGNRLGGKIAMHMMDAVDSFQIDEPGDLELMEALLNARRPVPSHSALASIRLLVLDFDGVMTDNRVIVTDDGHEAVACHRGDGWGIKELREHGLDMFVLSTETNPVVLMRSKKLKLECIHGCDDKLTTLQRIAGERGLLPAQIAYVGNDVNDLSCMRWVGLPIAVADAEPEVRGAALLVTSRPGGHGAVREVAEWILAAQSAPVPKPASGDSAVVPGGV